MKYLFLKSRNPKQHQLVPIDATLYVEYFNGVPYLMLGGRRLTDLDDHNKDNLLQFLAESFGRTDVVIIDSSGPIEKGE